MAITVTLAPDLETQIRSAAEQEGVAPDAFVGKLLQNHLHYQRITVSEPEELLLQQINLGLPEKTWLRYHQLTEKLQDETLQLEEQQELSQIINRLERANVRRIAALIKLAQLRKTTLDSLIYELGIRPAPYV